MNCEPDGEAYVPVPFPPHCSSLSRSCFGLNLFVPTKAKLSVRFARSQFVDDPMLSP